MSILSDNRANTFSNLPWFSDTAYANWIVHHLTHLGMTICDVGSANGFMLDFYKTHFNRVIGVEPNETFYNLCKNKFQDDPNVTLINATAESSGLPDNFVDICISRSAMHHFVNIEKSLDEMARVSSKQRVALIEVVAPALECIPFLTDILLIKEKGRKPNTVFTENILNSYLTKYSDEIISVYYDQFILVDTWLLNSDLEPEERNRIKEIILSQPEKIKRLMQMHYRNGEISMLRRMNLQISNPEFI